MDVVSTASGRSRSAAFACVPVEAGRVGAHGRQHQEAGSDDVEEMVSAGAQVATATPKELNQIAYDPRTEETIVASDDA